MCYKVDSCGLVIGLVDNQSGTKSKELFEKEFSKTIFRKYKKRIGDLKSDKYLYKPKGYHLFGDYNMAILALIDDFAFPNRVFHAGHGYGNNNEKYALQVISGISTESKYDGSNNGDNSLLKQAKSTFLNKDYKYPFIGITNYKINNGLLIGNGVEFLEMIKEHIQYLLKSNNVYHIDAICVDCFSNHELTIVYFSDSLQKIASFINITRALRLGNLISPSDTIAKNSLLYKYLTKPADINANKQIEKVKDSHIFATTFSHMGYEMSAEIPKEQLTLRYHWDLKPGHYSDFTMAIKDNDIFQIENEQIIPGSEMLEFSQSETILSYSKKIEALSSCPEIKTYVRKQRIHVVFSESQIIEQSLTNEKHPELACYLTKCTFPKEALNLLRGKLDKCRVSKVLKERTLKMYETFNDGITDPLFFNYFIELKNYLQGIIDKIRLYTDDTEESVSLEDFHIWLDSMIRNFEQAYYNRFHQSSRMKNISDFNLEYNGGIQQIISAYDMTYKVIVENFVKEEEAQQNCVYVSGYERVSSDRNSLRINIFHITYPELYASTVWKEAVNFYWDSLKNRKTEGLHAFNIERNNDLLFHPDYSKILQSKVRGSEKFDPSSYAHRLLLSSINEDFIHYLLADAIVANNAYLGNYELFEYWYWTYFAQMSHFYNRKGEMDAEVFIKFLVRLLFIKRLLSAEDKSTSDYSIFDSKLSELLFCHLQDVRSFADILFAELGRTDFSSYAEGTAAQSISREIGIHNLDKMLDEDNKKLSDFLDKLIKDLESQRESFKQGTIVCFDEKTNSPYAFVRSLTHSYLHTVRELALRNHSKIKILERDDQGKAVENPDYASIVSDPLGGIFMCNKEVRSEYFQRRSVFYKSLWGMSLKLKIKSINIE